MSQKLQVIEKASAPGATMSALCRSTASPGRPATSGFGASAEVRHVLQNLFQRAACRPRSRATTARPSCASATAGSAAACDRVVEFNEVRPYDALAGKTPADVYRDSERRSLEPLAPSYPLP